MSVGTVFLLSMREIDLSVGSIYGLSIIIGGGLITHGLNPWVAAGIALLLSDHGKWLISGGELDPNTLIGIKDGLIYGVVDAEIWQQGYIGARLLFDELTNSKYWGRTGWINTGVETVTKANIDAVIARQSSPTAQIAANEPSDDSLFSNLDAHIQPLLASQS